MIPGLIATLPIYYTHDALSAPVRRYLDMIDPASQNRSPAAVTHDIARDLNITPSEAVRRAVAISRLNDAQRLMLKLISQPSPL